VAVVAAAALAALSLQVMPASAAVVRYEAETAMISQGTVSSQHAGFSGTGFVDYMNVTGSYVEWTVSAQVAGQATLTFRFANGSTLNRPMDITVNGGLVADEKAFNPTGAWTTWTTTTMMANLNAGSNTIRATATTANGGPNVDYLEVTTADPAPDSLQAETATLSQAVVESTHAGFTGTGYVNYNNVVDSYVQWTVNRASAGAVGLVIRYANGSTGDRPMSITVNGAQVGTRTFGPTGAWSTWTTTTIPANLNAGDNTVRATATTAGGGPNVDRLDIGGVDTQPPSVPTNLRTTGSTSTSISLAWNASTDNVGVTGYVVREGNTVVASPTGTTATVGGLAPNSTHAYTVAARDAAGNESSRSAPVSGTTQPGGGAVMAAPYYYNGWGDPPNIGTVMMSVPGIKQFTMAFMLSGGGCVPRWDSQRPLLGGVDQATINTVRSRGGDVEISFGGWSGNKLGPNCSSASALAGAYQQVIDAYNLKYIDIDIENTDEFENFTVQDRILNALKIVKQNNPGIKTIITFGTATSGPTSTGVRLINRAAALQVNVDVFTIMPFDFGCTGGGANMFNCTVSAANGLRTALRNAFGWTDAQAYAHMGISGMNGISDVNETTTTTHWTQIRDWANTNHIARLAFWSVNRDRPCPGGGLSESCSGIGQTNWQFTSITAGFTG
jgi:hypothetical protein